MPSFNKVIVAGNLTRDPEVRFTTNGKAVCQVGLAINHTWRTEAGETKEDVTFVDITFWGKTAENLAQYKKKGECILVEGRLALDQWDDKQTGQKRSKLKVVCETVQFLSSKRADGDVPTPPRATAPASQPSGQPAGHPPPEDDDDIPF